MQKTLKNTIMALICSATLTGCGDTADKKTITPSTPTIENGLMTPEALWAFGRLGNATISPDGTKILYSVSYYSIEENTSNSELFVIDTDGKNKKQLTESPYKEIAAKWTNDSQHILFLSNRSGGMQVWEMNIENQKMTQKTERKGGISDFLLSPNGEKILFIANVKYSESTQDKYPDLPKASGRIVTDLMYKHWDEWVDEIPHPFVTEFSDKKMENAIDLLQDQPYESPMKPFGGIEQLAWSNDSKTIAYTCRKKVGKAYSESTNSDIYFYDVESDQTKNITEGMMGYDTNPVFSPDGQWIAWESMEHDGYESDKNRLFVMNLATNEKTDLSADFDQNSNGLVWSTDSKQIYFTSCHHAVTQIYSVNIATKQFTIHTQGVHDYQTALPSSKGLFGVKHSFSKPNEIYAVNEDGTATELTFENKALLDKIDMGKVEERWITTTDNKQMLTWVIYPPHFDPTKKYPTLLYCQGGPQSPVSQFWSYRWNMQMMAANGYIIVAPNRRGLPGFGHEWLTQISGDYGGQNMKDYLSAIDEVSKEPFVDNDKLGCVGASYGGFSVFWLAGHHQKRFKTFIAHDGMFNLPQQYLETEEMWFVNWDLGGAYWEKDNPVAQRSYANSPHLFVDKWDTPILVIHGEKDYRILASQGMAAFNAAILRGVPAELLIYPDENHWVLQPQNGILWQRTYFEWLDKWLK